jgi:hypothetical protein
MSTPPTQQHDLLKPSRSGSLGRRFGAGALVIAVLVGIQLGAIPWRYRRQIWQLQGFLLGAVVGYVVGRLSGRDLPSGSQLPPGPGGDGNGLA